MHKLKLLAPAVALCLMLTGCALAQPERELPKEDRWVGFHVVYEHWDMDAEVPDENGMVETPSLDRTHWTEYGTEEFSLEGMGNVTFAQEVLFAEYDEASNEFIFPGAEGQNAFAVTRGDITVGHHGLEQLHLTYGGDALTKLGGTIYYQYGGEEQYVTLYRVYETPDGRVYLNGDGNSFGGAGGFGATEKEEYATTINGEVETVSFEVALDIEALHPVVSVEIVEFDGNNRAIEAHEYDGTFDNYDIKLAKNTAWMMIIETDDEGVRTRHLVDRADDETYQNVHTAKFAKGDCALRMVTFSFE